MPQQQHFEIDLKQDNGTAISGASCTVYREGSTVNGTQSGVSPLVVTVFGPGKIVAGETVFIDADPATTYVASALSATSVTLSGFGGTLQITGGKRIVPLNNKPTLYPDDQGGGSALTNPLMTNSHGHADAFHSAGAVDYLISGAGTTPTLFPAYTAPREVAAQVRYADDFSEMPGTATGGIQEAIDDLPSAGGTVVCSGGKTYSCTKTVWLHSNVHLRGAGIGSTIIKRATGSILDTDAANTGAVIHTGPSVGTQYSSATTATNISISDLTIDGNQSNFGSLTTTALNPDGLRVRFVDGVAITNVTVQNTLGNGFRLELCRNLVANNLICDTVGQWSVSTARNGIHCFCDAAAAGEWGFNYNISNVTMKTVGDEAITIISARNMNFSNVTVDTCDFAVEIGGDTGTTAGTFGNLNFSNITARNCLFTMITVNSPVGYVYENVQFTNSQFIGHASTHNAGAINLNSGIENALRDISFHNCIFRNINTTDTTARSYVDAQTITSALANIRFVDCRFYGASASTRTNDIGFNIRCLGNNWLLQNVLLKDIPGIGVVLHQNGASTLQGTTLNNVVVDGCNSVGFDIRGDSATGTITEIYYNDCVAKDVAKQGANSGWRMLVNTGGTTVQNIFLRNCRSYKTSGTTHTYGLELNQSAGTLDKVYLENCDFTGTQTGDLNTSGTITNLRCSGYLVGTPQIITAVGNSITLPSLIKDCTIRLTADNSYTLTSAPTLANGGFEGQRVLIINEDTADTITIQDQGTLPSSNLRLSAATIALAPRDNIEFIWNSVIGDWVQVAQVNVI